MKPNFALHFTDSSIALLHRTAKGWLKVGETPFDAPDLDAALDYLRKTALGLEPGGFATKLVIPNDQVLYAEIAAPGPSDGERRAQIAAALQERTPYKADEIAFDWSGEGTILQVAAVAHETLAEAEGFAIQHRMDPVGFVAIPEEGSFSGEPWFGTVSNLADILPAGEEVERDSQPITLLAEPGRGRSRGPRSEDLPEAAPPLEAPPRDAPVAAPEERAALPETPAPQAIQRDAPQVSETTEAEAPAVAAPIPERADRRLDERAPELPFAAPPAEREAPQTAPAGTPSDFASATAFAEPSPLQAPPLREDPAPAKPGPSLSISGITAAPAMAAPAVAAPAAPPVAAPVATPAPVAAPPAAAAVPVPPPVQPQAPAQPAQQPVVADEEAPFTHIADPLPDADEAPAPRSEPSALRPDLHEDAAIPPAPSSAVLAARRSAGAPNAAGGAAVDAPRTGRAPPLTAAARGKPLSDLAASLAAPATSGAARSPAPQPQARPAPSVAARAATPARSEAPKANATKTAAKSLAGLVTAPGIPGTRKVKAKPAAPITTAQPSAEAAASLGRTDFGKHHHRPGKPRHLALILIAILLACLALVAVWSSFFLAGNDPAADEQTQIAANEMPAPEDEALADGIDPAGLTDESALSDTETLPDTARAEAGETAPAGAAETAPPPGPASVALGNSEDEIFLSSADAPPPAFDALSLPAPSAATEVPPEAPMPPPPFGTVYAYDSNGLIVPQKDGILSPDGYQIYAGKPATLPPPRSAAAEAAATAAASALAASAVVEALPPEALPAASPEAAAATTTASTAGNASAGNPSLVPAEPLAGAAQAAAQSETRPGEPAVQPEEQPHPELADRRPRARPASAATDLPDALPASDDDAALQSPAVASEFAGVKPPVRPASVEAAGATAAAAAAETARLAAAEAANPSLLAISRRPEARPRDFSRAVEAAVAAAVRSPEPEPEPVVVAAAAPQAAPKAAAQPRAADEADDEPDIAPAAMPKVPTKANVATQATYKKAINLSKVNLIGVYGTPNNRYALIRTAKGKYQKVKVGDKVDGGQIQAITQTEVRYQKGGRLLALAMPKG